jgi:hypothetical protein
VTTTKTEVSSKLWKLGESITVTELEVCAGERPLSAEFMETH